MGLDLIESKMQCMILELWATIAKFPRFCDVHVTYRSQDSSSWPGQGLVVVLRYFWELYWNQEPVIFYFFRGPQVALARKAAWI